MFSKYLKIIVTVVSIFIIGCSAPEKDSGEIIIDKSNQTMEKLNILATTPMLAEYVRQVANENVDLNILMPYGVDPHSFEASPQDIKKISDADLVFYVGLKYESTGVVKLLENSVSSENILINLGSGINPIQFTKEGHDDHDDDGNHEGHDDHDDDGDHEGHDDHDDDGDHEGHDDHDDDGDHEGHNHGVYDPHFWFDPTRVALAVEIIKDELVKIDSANQTSYESNAKNYFNTLKVLDENISTLISTIPVENRQIITTHEALGYLESKYDIEILTTLIPSLNSENGITPKSLRSTIEQIEKHNIKVMFLEEETPSQYNTTIKQETGIKLVTGLWVETLIEGQTYVKWLEDNVNIIVDNLPKEAHDDHDDDDHDDDKE